MRTKHKNEIFNLIQDLNLGLENFSLEDSLEPTFEQLPITTLQFKDSPLCFIFRSSSNDFNLYDYKYSKFGPGYPLTNYFPTSGHEPFNRVFATCNWWLNNVVKLYIEDEFEPNLWDAFKKRNKSFDFEKIDFDEQESFTIEEKKTS